MLVAPWEKDSGRSRADASSILRSWYAARRGDFMKTVLLPFLVAAAAAVVSAADTPSLAGKWDIHTSISGNESDMACTITQKDDAIGGSCATQRGTVEITGRIEGS